MPADSASSPATEVSRGPALSGYSRRTTVGRRILRRACPPTISTSSTPPITPNVGLFPFSRGEFIGNTEQPSEDELREDICNQSGDWRESPTHPFFQKPRPAWIFLAIYSSSSPSLAGGVRIPDHSNRGNGWSCNAYGYDRRWLTVTGDRKLDRNAAGESRSPCMLKKTVCLSSERMLAQVNT